MTFKQIFFQLLQNPDKFNGDLPFLYNTKGELFSYKQANAVIQTILGKLSIATIPTATVVALYSEKNMAAVLQIQGIMLSNHAYLPIDSRSPLSRILNILQQAKPSAIIVQEQFVERLTQELKKTETNFSIADFDFDYKLFVFTNYNTYHEDLAYILFTSGSTGIPKGIMHSYKSVLAFVNWCGQTFSTNIPSKFISIAPFQFDLSVHDLFVPLLHSASLLLAAENETSNSRLMAQIISEQKIDVVYSTPSFFNWLLETGRMERYDFAEVKSVLIAGEILRWETVKRLQKYFTQAQFYNLYGPTETNVCLSYKINFADEEKYNKSVPIGVPCNYSQMKLSKTEAENRLFIGGATLMDGYVNNNIACFENMDGKKFYNTGDLLEETFEGNYAFVSRADAMIKRNGYRIEPAEIETGLKRLAGVRHVIVVSQKENDTVKLHAFIISDQKYETVFLKNFCVTEIHYAMVPDSFTFIESFPLNKNHKTDTVELIKLISVS